MVLAFFHKLFGGQHAFILGHREMVHLKHGPLTLMQVEGETLEKDEHGWGSW